MKYLRDILFPILAFLLGAAVLTLLSHLQHRFNTGAHSWRAFLVPVIVGGTAGAAIYVMRQRINDLSIQLSNLSVSALRIESYLQAQSKVSTFFLLLTTTVAGCLILSVLSLSQKLINGFPINPRGFAIPVPIGSLAGFLFGLYLNRLKQFQAFQTEALKSLSGQRRYLSNIIETINDGILVTDVSGKIELANPACRLHLGIEQDTLQGADLWESLQQLTSPYQEELFSIPPHNTPFLVQAGQTKKILRGIVNPLLDDKQQQAGLVMVLQDMSQEKKNERMKAEFISTATHELNTPISALAGYSELLLSESFSPEQQKEFIETISQKAWQVNGILDNLLHIDSVGSPQHIVLDRETYSVAETMKQLEKCADQVQKTHQIEYVIQDQTIELSVDLKKLKKIFCHLISNAAKFSEEGSTIFIRTHADEDRYFFEFKDQGIGMTEEECKHAFDTFFRADASDTALAGIGLGMSVVKALVEAHGGEIKLTSIPGKGTTVKFFLPIS